MSIGLIHMDCYCGAELFYLGNTEDGEPPAEIVDQLKASLGPGNYGIFTSGDGSYGECPFCGLLIELPDASVMDWLPFLDKENFTSALEDLQGKKLDKRRSREDRPTLRHNLI